MRPRSLKLNVPCKLQATLLKTSKKFSLKINEKIEAKKSVKISELLNESVCFKSAYIVQFLISRSESKLN